MRSVVSEGFGAKPPPDCPGHRATPADARNRSCVDLARDVLERRGMTTTAWGEATVLEEITIKPSAAEGRSFATLVQLLEGKSGELLVRFAYSTGGTARRGPVTLRRADLERMRKSLAKAPRLRAALRLSGC